MKYEDYKQFKSDVNIKYGDVDEQKQGTQKALVRALNFVSHPDAQRYRSTHDAVPAWRCGSIVIC